MDKSQMQWQKAEGPDGSFWHLSIAVPSWDEIPDDVVARFGAENDAGQKWLACIPV